MSSIPEDVYLDILSRLSVKQLFQCKCVCKSWFQIISDPSFVKMHCNRVSQQSNPSIMFSNRESKSKCWEINTLVYDSLDSSLEFDDVVVKNKYPFETSFYSDFEFFGHCNGLLYFWFRCRTLFCLWNPTTNEHKIIPNPQDNMYHTYDILVCGFGYDCNIDDYKLIMFWKLCETNKRGRYRCLVGVYTLGTDLWRSSQTEIDNIYPPSIEAGVLVNGALHRLAKKHSEHSNLIFCLDISNEKLNELEPPKESIDNNTYSSMTMGALEGLLCVLNEVYVVGVEVWVMQDYGIRESWSKRYTITHEKIRRSCWSVDVKLVSSFKSGKLLFWNRMTHKLVLYDPKHETARELGSQGKNLFYPVNYFESLVSVNSGTYVGGHKETKKNNKKEDPYSD